MPNLTPVKYRSLYQIYPAKACIEESAADCSSCLREQIRSLGRFAGQGPGGRGDKVETLLASTLKPGMELVELQVQSHAF